MPLLAMQRRHSFAARAGFACTYCGIIDMMAGGKERYVTADGRMFHHRVSCPPPTEGGEDFVEYKASLAPTSEEAQEARTFWGEWFGRKPISKEGLL